MGYHCYLSPYSTAPSAPLSFLSKMLDLLGLNSGGRVCFREPNCVHWTHTVEEQAAAQVHAFEINTSPLCSYELSLQWNQKHVQVCMAACSHTDSLIWTHIFPVFPVTSRGQSSFTSQSCVTDQTFLLQDWTTSQAVYLGTVLWLTTVHHLLFSSPWANLSLVHLSQG